MADEDDERLWHPFLMQTDSGWACPKINKREIRPHKHVLFINCIQHYYTCLMVPLQITYVRVKLRRDEPCRLIDPIQAQVKKKKKNEKFSHVPLSLCKLGIWVCFRMARISLGHQNMALMLAQMVVSYGPRYSGLGWPGQAQFAAPLSPGMNNHMEITFHGLVI